jgi:O-antigen ligase
MQVLLVTLIGFLTLSSVFDWNPGPMPGVKINNGILYLLTVGVLLRMALAGKLKFELRGLHATFLILIAYSVFSYLAVVFFIEYPYYDALDNALLLKGLVDQMLFFTVFFYTVTDERDAARMLKWLVAAWAISHAMAILDAVGIYRVGDITQRKDGRVQGLMGESNQYGAFVAMSLPAMISVALLARGVWRTLWILAAVVTAVTLLMTVSRGAFVGIAVGAICGVLFFKRYVPGRRLAMWGAATAISLVLVLIIAVALGFGDLLYERLIADTNSGDMDTTSSGRTQIWSTAIGVMMEKPITLITGYGWRSYWTMPFKFSPHSFYVNQWFNLGLVGLGCGLVLLLWPIKLARSAVDRATEVERTILMGFVIATVTFAVSTFFVDLVVTWLYFWAYAGIALRIAVNIAKRSYAAEPTGPIAARAAQLPRADIYGWNAARR